MPLTSTSVSASSLRTRIWRGTFSKLEAQALRAQAVPAADGLKRREVFAPAAFLVRPAAEGRAASRAVKFPHGRAYPLEMPAAGPTCCSVRGRSPLVQGDRAMASIQRFDPFNELVDDFFKGFLVRPLAYDGRDTPLARAKVDVTERNGAYVVAAELPGVKKDDIEVTIDGAQVTLAAEVKREREVEKDERVLHTERTFGKVTRSFTLPQEVDEAKAEAKFRDGV